MRISSISAKRGLSASAVYLLSALAVLTSCTPRNTPSLEGGREEAPDTVIVSPLEEGLGEVYRPQVHYTVARNWMNDPNGLCYTDGIWHLYYQYNPNGIDCDFGGMSWGHATSKDLMHWTERETVLYPDEMGAMFSGCSVVDTENKAGFGAGAVLAYYTASSDKQKICLAISNDGGMTFRKYEHNPIVPSTGLANFRDPKVVWDAAHNQYVMVIAKGWDQGLEFWRSTNLRDWSFVPYIFHAEEARCNLGQYECPDLFWLPYEGESMVNGQSSNGKWILVLSTMPGGYIHGSGTMYFIGDLTPEGYFMTSPNPSSRGEILWLDYGADYYAAVSWDNAPDGRKVAIGWMNNWDYAPACPPTEWKSAFAMPREYSLRQIDGKTVLCSNPVAEIENIAGDWIELESKTLPLPLLGKGSGEAGEKGLSFELRATCSLAEDDTIRLYNPYGEWYEIRIDSRCRKIISDRSRSGQRHFSPLFAVPAMTAPIFGSADEVELRLIVDQSSVEFFADSGAVCVTNTVYPRCIYNHVSTSAAVKNLKFRKLESTLK